jgi:hypothetical protein
MNWICFSRSGIGSITAWPEKEIFTRRFFVEKRLDDFDKEWAQTQPKKRSRGTFLHLDEARTHRADDDFDYLGITRLSHRPIAWTSHPWLLAVREPENKPEGNTFTSAME